jgi:hypothetical protein
LFLQVVLAEMVPPSMWRGPVKVLLSLIISPELIVAIPMAPVVFPAKVLLVMEEGTSVPVM